MNIEAPIEETIETRLVNLRLHHQILKLECEHWESEIVFLKRSREQLLAGYRTFISPRAIRSGCALVRSNQLQLQEAEAHYKQSKFNLEGTVSFIRFLDEQTEETTVDDDQ